MWVGSENRWGFSFKEDCEISIDKRAVIGSVLARHDKLKCFFKVAKVKPNDEELHIPNGIIVFGIAHDFGDLKTMGVVWMPTGEDVHEVFHCSGIEGDYCWFPYVMKDDHTFYIYDGELYEV